MTIYSHFHDGMPVTYTDECPVCATEVEKSMDDDLKNRFTYHETKEGQAELYQRIRSMAGEYAQFIRDNTSGSREQSLALTKLEEAVFWANAAIARNT